jgi:hypothetical protein
MGKIARMAALAALLTGVLAVSNSAQILLNELDVNPGGTDDGCEYIELIGPPGAIVENVYFLSIEGDSNANEGQVTGLITFASPGPAIGSNGLLVVVSANGCPPRTYAAGTTVLTTSALNSGILQNTSNSFLLVSSPTAIALNSDLDANDDGVLELPSGAVVLDGIAWTDNGATDLIYAPQLIASGTTIGGATRFPGDLRANNSRAWYGGIRIGAPADPTYSATLRTANFPSNGALTPGAVNVGDSGRNAPVDMNGDGRTDYTVVRPAGGVGTQLTWLTQYNGGVPEAPRDWGLSGDQVLTADYDGDFKDDITVFRPSAATFYIINSATFTLRVDQFGQNGDNARIVGDYDGDGRDDLAVYRAGSPSRWFYKTSATKYFETITWGETADTPAPGDYDGDGKTDFVVFRASGAVGQFWKRLSTGAFVTDQFGQATDDVVPGDYDDDGRTDMAVVRVAGGLYQWDFDPSSIAGTTVVSDTWGVPGDFVVQGDYDGDGKTDYAVWRPGSPAVFYVMTVGDRRIFIKDWGQTGDYPVANYQFY